MASTFTKGKTQSATTAEPQEFSVRLSREGTDLYDNAMNAGEWKVAIPTPVPTFGWMHFTRVPVIPTTVSEWNLLSN